MTDTETKLRKAWGSRGTCWTCHAERASRTEHCLRCALDACFDLLAAQRAQLAEADALVRLWATKVQSGGPVREYIAKYPTPITKP